MAVSDSVGTHTMWVDAPGSAKNTLNPKWVDTLRTDAQRFGTTLQFAQELEVKTTTLEELFRIHGRPYYIKIDVEGHEPAVLKGLQSAVPYVSFEVNLPEFKPEAVQRKDVREITQSIQQMAAAGAILAPDDPAIDEIRDLLGLSKQDLDSVFRDSVLMPKGAPMPPGMGPEPEPEDPDEEEEEEEETVEKGVRDPDGRGGPNLPADRGGDYMPNPIRVLKSPEWVRAVQAAAPQSLQTAARIIQDGRDETVLVKWLATLQPTVHAPTVERMKGGVISRISVIRFRGESIIWDGNHRAAAAALAGQKEIPARVLEVLEPGTF
jgi:hypothetical protein